MKPVFLVTLLLTLCSYAFGNPHPAHKVLTETKRFKGTTFEVVTFPNCEHVETLITYTLPPETRKKAKERLNGFAASNASFYNPNNCGAVSFLRKEGKNFVGALHKRPVLIIEKNAPLSISDDYLPLKNNRNVDGIALGQLLNPLRKDGFNSSFMNRVTGRMAIGITEENTTKIVRGRASIYTLSEFIKKEGCKTAANVDGGHTLMGTSPIHLVFRWRKAGP